MEMLLTGKPIDAQTALSWGLVNRVVPADELDAAVREFTDVVAARSRAVIGLGKEAFYRQIDRSLESAYDIASETMARTLMLRDAAEGMEAFLQKRPARWGDQEAPPSGGPVTTVVPTSRSMSGR
jgi:enoyl-CoA hydratase/carnithine racemase